MKHYTLDRWVDFARGLAEPEEGARMLEHLAAGCDRCQRDADFWTEVSQSCQRLGAQDVPESVTRLARAISPVRVVEMPARGMRLPIELIYDRLSRSRPSRLARYLAGRLARSLPCRRLFG